MSSSDITQIRPTLEERALCFIPQKNLFGPRPWRPPAGALPRSFKSQTMCTSCWCQENQFYLNYWTFSVDVSKASQTPHSENWAQEPLRSPLVPSSISVWWWKSLRRVRLFASLWTIARQPPLSMGFSRQEYWSGLPFPSPGDLPDPGIELGFSALQAESLPS